MEIFFKVSPVGNSILQKNVNIQEGKDLSLIIDCKTKWNSIQPMLERIIKLKSCLKNVLNDLDALHLWDEKMINVLELLADTLKPIQLAVEGLSSENATLLSSEAVLLFLFDKLHDLKTDLSTKMLTQLKIIVGEWRYKTMVSLAKYSKTQLLLQKGRMISTTFYVNNKKWYDKLWKRFG